MSHIFVSYSRRDAAFAQKVIHYLERAGYRVWVDKQGIAGGNQWRMQIVQAIQQADAFLLLLSPNSMRSDNVRKELDLAEEAKVRVFPAEIDVVKIPDGLKYQLAGVQIIDLWRDSSRGMQQLIESLTRHGVRRGAAGSAGPRPSGGRGQDPRVARSTGKGKPPNVDLSQLGGASFLDRFSLKGLFRRKS